MGLAFVGCGQQESNTPPKSTLRLHWIGASAISADTNAATLKRIWNMPETVSLASQTFDKLAQAPWTLKRAEPDAQAGALLRPLIDDLVPDEWKLELWPDADGQNAWMLAVRLSPERSRLWETNLFQVARALVSGEPGAFSDNRAGWVVKEAGGDRLTGLCRSGGWTLLGVAADEEDFNRAAARVLAADETQDVAPSGPWMAGMADLPDLLSALHPDWLDPGDLPVVDFKINPRGDGERISTEATLTFASPLEIDLQPWNVPTNLIDQSQTSLTAVRGLSRWVSSMKLWKNLQIGPAPEQMFVWALRGQGYFTYFTATTPDPAKTVKRVADQVMEHQDSWFDKSGQGGFRRSTTGGGVEWSGVPFMWPFLTTAVTNDQAYVLGGGFRFNPVVNPPPAELFGEALSGDDLVYFDWEHSGERMQQWLYMGQFMRMVTQHTQLPFESRSVAWIKTMASELGQSVTRVTLAEPDQLKLIRTSTLGLTALELHLLADWLESPTFPVGFHTFAAPRPKPPPSASQQPPAQTGPGTSQ